MPHKVRQTYSYGFFNIGDMKNHTVHTIKNPFCNLLDMVKNYYNIYKNGSQKDLINFVTSSTPTKNGGALVDGDFLSFIYDMMFSSLDPDLDDPWMNFDEVELEEILKDPFFDEYNDWSFSHIYEKLYDTEKYKKLSKKNIFYK